MVKRRNLLHFNNGARSERDLGDLVTKVFEKAAKKNRNRYTHLAFRC